MEKNFFTAIPAFTDFLEVQNQKHYHPAPDDWFIIITDVRNSTQAIEQGKYKDVNIVGAAGITAALNVCGRMPIPYVFGGDGATILIPPEIREKTIAALLNTRQLCKSQFELDLRVGIVQLAEIRKRGGDIMVARYQVSPGISLAMFSGGGLNLAEKLIKEEPGYCLEDDTEGQPDLSGLSCRWEPLRPRHGKMLSLLVKANDAKSYNDILKEINSITGGRDNAPASDANTKFKWPPSGLMQEAKIGGGIVWLRLIGLYMFTLLVFILLRLNKALKDFNPMQYRRDVVRNADYRKFDDMLRMVIDCSEEQAEKIRKYLEEIRKVGKIFYGMHLSDTALMTCLVFSTNQDGHVHFIDGSDGGYAAAAKELKSQMKATA